LCPTCKYVLKQGNTICYPIQRHVQDNTYTKKHIKQMKTTSKEAIMKRK